MLGMMPEAFDADKYERTLKQEGREDEIEIGKEIGTERTALLTGKLLEQDRLDDLERMTKEPAYREQLFRELGL
ncbi:MAG: hypothetical protein HFI50_02540 [Lachnospiraceae bacterium]|jgi:hypothetical protein|nr:hypothetical protein [Lachnospiraceae bacterium]